MKKSILEGRPELANAIANIAETTNYLWQKGWAERNGGNLTLNITDMVDDGIRALPPISDPIQIGTVLPNIRGLYFYVKGTGKRMRDLYHDPMANGTVIRILDDGASYEMVADNYVMPTSELPSHLSIQNFLVTEKPSYKATLHTHPVELVAMSHCRKFLDSRLLSHLLWSMIPETLAFAPLGIGVVPYGLPSSIWLADATLEKIRDYDVVLWEKHGTVAVGTDVMDAFDQTDVLNKAACIYMAGKNMGFEPEGMSDEAILNIQKTFNLPIR